MADNYLRRIEALEQELGPVVPAAPPVLASLHDSDARVAAWLEIRGQRFDRGAEEPEDDFPKRVLESLGLSEDDVMVVHFVASAA
jgi:hypothetical protein